MINKEPKKEQYYDMYLTCENCGENEQFEIPFGVSVKSFAKKATCEGCGCKLG